MSLPFRVRLLPFVLLTSLGLAHAQPTSPIAPENAPQGTPVPAAKPDRAELTPDLFYRLLLGDIAAQRGEPALAARAYLEAAREAKDPRLARRATETALASRQRGLAQDAAKLWSELDPQAERPRQVLAALAAGASGRELPEPGPSEELRVRLERLLADAALSGQGVGEVFLQLNRLFGQQADKRAVYALIRDIAQPYPKSAEAHFAVALAAYNAALPDQGADAVARSEIEKALELRPDWERAALLNAEIRSKQSAESAIAYLEQFIAAQPDAKSATGALAQFYVEAKRYPDARALMQKLWDREPASRELEFALAAIELQMKDYASAEKLLLDLKKVGYGEAGAIDLYLAQVAEETKRWDEAITRYKAVNEGDRVWLAKLRIGAMYGKQKRLDEASKWFASLSPSSPEEKIQLKQAEAQTLRDAGDDNAAYGVLKRGLVDNPDSTDLIYDLAMVAERLNLLDETEAHLKRLIELKPNDAQALNALGYTLVDRTPRTDEGYALIEKAHQIAPRDPFILDSLGWALFRMGRLDEAEAYLKRALSERPDAEIAAHLGEVMWKRGDRASAQALWQAQLESNPENPVLKETVQRLAH